jgi:ornithine cyclodeaminase
MQFITDESVRKHITHTDAFEAMQTAFKIFGEKNAVNLTRSRATIDNITISSMGAVMPSLGLMGTKVYPTIAGQFNFLITLFSTHTGEMLAVIQGNALTEFRTANVTLLAAKHLASTQSRTLCVFGSGAQAKSHLAAFLPAYKWQNVYLIDPWGNSQALCREMTQNYGVPVNLSAAQTAVEKSDIIITATRSKTPLFNGQWVKPGAFVAAIGSSKPDTREVDDVLLKRCACIAVEERGQALRETGDFVLAAESAFNSANVLELGQLLQSSSPYTRNSQDITLYKSVGIGLEDIALAAHVWHKLKNTSTPN